MGVTVIVATMGVEPELTGVKLGIDPKPDAAKPIEGLEFVQLYPVPTTLEENEIGELKEFAQIEIEVTGFITGFGFTVIVYDPLAKQPPDAIALTNMVPEIGTFDEFVAVKLGGVNVGPLEGSPIDGFELFQFIFVTNTAPEVVIFAGGTTVPAQTLIFAGKLKLTDGLALIIKLPDGVGQPFELKFTIEIVIVPLPVKPNPGILPVPLAARPKLGLELVQVDEAGKAYPGKLIQRLKKGKTGGGGVG